MVPAKPKEVPKEAPKTAVPAARPEPPKPEPEDPLKTIGKLIQTDPGQAVAVLKPLVLAKPGSVELQGNYLSALYRTRNAVDFERALTRATVNGVTVRNMLSVPAFRAAMVDESRLQKAKPPAGVLPQEVMAKVLEGL